MFKGHTYPRMGIMISQSFKGNKKNTFENMHPSTPLPKQQQAMPLCVCMQPAASEVLRHNLLTLAGLPSHNTCTIIQFVKRFTIEVRLENIKQK